MRKHPGRPILRDAATICTAVLRTEIQILARCELNKDHDGKHRSGCTSWAATRSQRTAP